MFAFEDELPLVWMLVLHLLDEQNTAKGMALVAMVPIMNIMSHKVQNIFLFGENWVIQPEQIS